MTRGVTAGLAGSGGATNVARLTTAWRAVARHRALLWWLHSFYALAFGIGVMWLGSRHYEFLRVTVLYVGFIWVTSLLVPAIARLPWLSPPWRERVRLAINYLHRNFYQQVLFFLLPIYYASATVPSRNILFVAFIAICAILSTLDVVYDRHMSVRRTLMAVFFAFNLFACINVMLPSVWRISNAVALPASALIALGAFISIIWPKTEDERRNALVAIGTSGAVLLATVVWGRGFIPPAPLQLVHSDFGRSIDPVRYRVPSPDGELPAGWSGPVYGMTAILAPVGLEDKVGHRWYLDGQLLFASGFHVVRGGRADGFRLWTSVVLPHAAAPGSRLRLEVVTEAGQMIGGSQIRVAGQ
jgi:hypothetical protein